MPESFKQFNSFLLIFAGQTMVLPRSQDPVMKRKTDEDGIVQELFGVLLHGIGCSEIHEKILKGQSIGYRRRA